MNTSAQEKTYPYFESKAPGVYLEREFRKPHRTPFSTGVPAFLGSISSAPNSGNKDSRPILQMISLWSHFEAHIGKLSPDSYLAYAVRGFFENGGHWCYVVGLRDDTAGSLEAGLDAIAPLNTIDLVCAPDLAKTKDKARLFDLQQLVVNHCETMGDRFAILDAGYDLVSSKYQSNDQVWEQWSEIDGKNGAIYYPWVKVREFPPHKDLLPVPPCGHVAGVYARSDRSRGGVHKAPANEVLEGVVDLERQLTEADQADLNHKRINCMRSFPGRGIRVYGARTLSGEQAWTYVNVRRLFLTVVRWIDWNMSDIPFEPNEPKLWARVERELHTFFADLYRSGALQGRTPEESFYVKCNAETNPPELRELGQVVTEIGLAPTIPYEFVVVRLIHGARGVSINGPTRP